MRQAREGGIEVMLLQRQGSSDPLVKIETPWGTPPLLASHRCRSRASIRAFFAVVLSGTVSPNAVTACCQPKRPSPQAPSVCNFSMVKWIRAGIFAAAGS